MSTVTIPRSTTTIDSIRNNRVEIALLALATRLTLVAERSAGRRNARLQNDAASFADAQRERVLADAHLMGALRR